LGSVAAVASELSATRQACAHPTMFCKATCSASDPAKDSVKVDPSAIERQRLEDEREEAERLARAQAEEEGRLQEEAERARREEAMRRQEQEERAQREAEERARLEQARREQACREQEEEAQREREEKARLQREEAQRNKQRQQEEEEERERQEALGQFYTRHGFTGVNEPRRSSCAVLRAAMTYPLHCAAELGDEGIVCMLLKEGAATSQKDSSGRTAAQVAQRKNKGGSHEGVLRVLGASAGKPCAGGA